MERVRVFRWYVGSICTGRGYPRKRIPGHAGCATPTRATWAATPVHITDEGSICHEMVYAYHEAGVWCIRCVLCVQYSLQGGRWGRFRCQAGSTVGASHCRISLTGPSSSGSRRKRGKKQIPESGKKKKKKEGRQNNQERSRTRVHVAFLQQEKQTGRKTVNTILRT